MFFWRHPIIEKYSGITTLTIIQFSISIKRKSPSRSLYKFVRETTLNALLSLLLAIKTLAMLTECYFSLSG